MNVNEIGDKYDELKRLVRMKESLHTFSDCEVKKRLLVEIEGIINCPGSITESDPPTHVNPLNQLTRRTLGRILRFLVNSRDILDSELTPSLVDELDEVISSLREALLNE
jgi:hypothetical protein